MLEQTDTNASVGKIAGWAAVNLAAIFLIAGLIAIYLRSGETTAKLILFLVGLFGAGILIAGSQSLFLRLAHIIIPGDYWGWIISGIISSLVSFLGVAGIIFVSVFALGDSMTDRAIWILYILFILMVICFQKFILSIVQSLRLKKDCKKVLPWFAIHIFGYFIGPVISIIILGYLNIDIGPIELVIFAAGMVFLVELASGRRLFQVFATSAGWRVDPAYQNAIRAGRAFQAGPGRQDLCGRNFDGADFRKANLRRANLEGVSCEPVVVTKMNHGWFYFLIEVFGHSAGGPYYPVNEMKSTNFSKVDLTGANLKYAKLREADFSKAILKQANLTEASLKHALLMDADLENAILTGADLTDAILYKTNLERADLTGATLKGADLENANLKYAILHRADLRKVKNFNSAILTGADLSGAIMPNEEELFKV